MSTGIRSNIPRSPWIDISVTLRNGLVCWPGDTPFRIERRQDMMKGDSNNLSEIRTGAHSGTHIDAPLHFIADGASIEEMPFEAMIGRARVIEIKDTGAIMPRELKQHHIRRGERILFKTENSMRAWRTDSFVEDFVSISKEAARFLAERKIVLVGIDYLSVGSYKHNGTETHRTLLEAGIWIIEGLDLSQVTAGRYDLICLPLKLGQAEGAPARAVIRPARIPRSQPKVSPV